MQKQPSKLKLLSQIFMTFFKISPMTFGGGFASIPLIEREVVDHRGWVKSQELSDILAVAQSVPGAIAVNSAIFTGYRLAGVMGALAATFGVMLPNIVIVVLLCGVYLQFQDNPKIEAAFVSIKATIAALIAFAAFRFGKSAAVDKTSWALILATVAILYFLHIHPLFLILIGGAAGIGIVFLKKRLGLAVQFERERAETYTCADYYFGEGI